MLESPKHKNTNPQGKIQKMKNHEKNNSVLVPFYCTFQILQHTQKENFYQKKKNYTHTHTHVKTVMLAAVLSVSEDNKNL
jgi:hypothetical protein